MAGEKFPGVIIGSVIELRFPFSGVLRSLGKHIGDTVKPGELIASLDTTLLQKELDVQLADYERICADFEIFNFKNKNTDQLTNYQKKMVQAELDVSVKAVEIAKTKLDQANLYSPVSGLVLDVGGLVAGLNITPSVNSLQILDFSGFSFRLEIPQEKLSLFYQPHRAVIHLPNYPDALTGTTSSPLPGSKGQFVINIRLDPNPHLLPGLSGEAELTE